MNYIEIIISNLRHRGVTADDLVAEIVFRRENITVNDKKCFGYSTEELEVALTYWDVC